MNCEFPVYSTFANKIGVGLSWWVYSKLSESYAFLLCGIRIEMLLVIQQLTGFAVKHIYAIKKWSCSLVRRIHLLIIRLHIPRLPSRFCVVQLATRPVFACWFFECEMNSILLSYGHHKVIYWTNTGQIFCNEVWAFPNFTTAFDVRPHNSKAFWFFSSIEIAPVFKSVYDAFQ